MFSVFKKGFSDPNEGHSVKVKRQARGPSAKNEKDTVQPSQRKQKHQPGLLACKSNGIVSRAYILATKQTSFGRKAITYNLFYHLIVVMLVDDHEPPLSRGGHTPPHTLSLGYKDKFHQTTRRGKHHAKGYPLSDSTLYDKEGKVCVGGGSGEGRGPPEGA